jgi:YlzJ-like protein
MTWLWSIVPTEFVFASTDTAAPKYRELNIEGATMLVEPLPGGMGRIERVISGNPQHYLRPEWQPGQYIALSPSTLL